MNRDIAHYHEAFEPTEAEVCALLASEIDAALPEAESKIWHRIPVWFIGGNPIVGYGKLKGCIRLLFWSGQSFEEPGLAKEGSFQAAEARYESPQDVDVDALRRWLAKSRDVQWDYKNIVKRKGKLGRLK